MDFSSINKVSRVAEFLPTRKLSELAVQSDHPISNMRAVQTKFGKRYIADIANEFAVFLPGRLVKAFDEDLQSFESMLQLARDGQLYMRYIGGKYNSVEFHHHL